MTEKFSDLLQFTTQVSRLMVTEIRRRASNKSTGICHRNQQKLIYLKGQFGKSAIKTKQKIDPILSSEVLIPFPIPFLTVTCFCWYQHRLLPMDHYYPSPHPFNTLCFLLNKIQIPSMTFSTHSESVDIHTHTHTHTHTHWEYTHGTHGCSCLPFSVSCYLFLLYFSVFQPNWVACSPVCVFFPIPVMHHWGRSISPIPLLVHLNLSLD